MQNDLNIKIVFIILLAFLVFERLSNTFNVKKPVKTKKTFQKNLFYLLLSVYLTIILISCWKFFKLDQINISISSIGFLILSLGIYIRRSAIHELNEYWSVFVEIKENQQRIKKGIYKRLKHPYYLAVLLELAGFSLLCNAWLGLLLTITIQAPLLIVRIHYENKIMKVYGKRMGYDA